jgi:hypothetical protein
MAATYDPSLGTDRDYVRFLVPDRDTANPKFQDEEIDAVISEQQGKGRTGKSTKYFAAAQLVSVQISSNALTGNGIQRKEVDELEVEYGIDTGTKESLLNHQEWLLAEGRRCLAPRPRMFRAYGKV